MNQIADTSRILGHLDRKSREKIADYLRGIGSHEGFEQDVTETLKAAIVAEYRSFIERSLGIAGDACEGSRTSALERLVAALLPNKSQKSRWQRGETEIGWDYLFLGLAAFDIDFRGHWPNPRFVKRNAIMHTMRHIRMGYMREATASTQLNDRTFEGVRATTFNPTWKRGLDMNDAALLHFASIEISMEVSRQLGAKHVFEVSEIQQVILTWWKPWVLFHAAIPFDWNY